MVIQAYCGRGIFLHRTDREAATADGGASLLTDEIHEHKGVVSQYIDPPFLLDGLKSDVRLYVLVTSFHPLTCYLYDEGLARFATEPYSTSALDERCGHLTNYSLNKHSDKFVKNTNEAEDGTGSKWSLSAFKRRLVREWGEERASRLWHEVDDLVVKTCIAAEPTVAEAMADHHPAAARGEPVRSCFQVFGFDVMLDAGGKPYLLEVNLDPALRTESPLDLRIKSGMLIDLLNVVGMPLPPAAGAPPSEAVPAGAERNKENATAAAAAAVDISDDASVAEGVSASAAKSAYEADGGALAAWLAWVRGPKSASAAPGAPELCDAERWALHLVNAEYERSKAGKWRRLFPSPRSEEYLPFLDPARPMHRLPFDV